MLCHGKLYGYITNNSGSCLLGCNSTQYDKMVPTFHMHPPHPLHAYSCNVNIGPDGGDIVGVCNFGYQPNHDTSDCSRTMSSATKISNLTPNIQHHKALTVLYNIQIQSSFLGHCPSSLDFWTLIHCVSEASFASIFRLEAPNLLDPLDQAILSHWGPQKHSTSLDKLLRTGLVQKI